MIKIDFVKRWLSRILVALTVSAVYLYGYPSATISYFVVDLFHVAIGIVLPILFFLHCTVAPPRITAGPSGLDLAGSGSAPRNRVDQNRYAPSAEAVAVYAY